MAGKEKRQRSKEGPPMAPRGYPSGFGPWGKKCYPKNVTKSRYYMRYFC